MTESHSPDRDDESLSAQDSGSPDATKQEVAHGHDGAVPDDQVEADRAHQEQQSRGD